MYRKDRTRVLKINTKDKYLKLDDTTWWQGVFRWYRGDSRITMYEKIQFYSRK